MSDYLRLADEAEEEAQRHRDAIPHVASNNDASLELTQAEFLESLASAIREQAGEIEQLEKENERLQRVVDLTESFFGAVAQGYPDWENEKRAELVVEAIAALTPTPEEKEE